MKMHALKLTLATAALLGATGLALAEDTRLPMQTSHDNFAARSGCGLYGPCYRVSNTVRPHGVTQSAADHDNRPAMVGFHEVLGTHGYIAGYETFNVIDSIR